MLNNLQAEKLTSVKKAASQQFYLQDDAARKEQLKKIYHEQIT